MQESISTQSGAYTLLIRAERERRITVGKLGTMRVRVGFYAYVGSAFGPGGLAARVRRHLKREKTLHWHIDYLRAVADVEQVWFAAANEKRECRWAEVIGDLPDAVLPLDGFGASDCGCRSHLFYFSACPSWNMVRRRLRRIAPRGGTYIRRAANEIILPM